VSGSNPVLVAGAPLAWTAELAAIAAAGEPVLAADSGADSLARLGLRAELVIGDLDSISSATRAWLGEDALVHLPDQERTDLDKALAHAFGPLGLERLTVLAATGGRVDHDAANLGLLARLALGERLRFVTADATLVAVAGAVELPAAPGETWSFWTYDPGVTVRLDGLHWPVAGEALCLAGRPSVSNIATAERVRVRTAGGAVIAMRQHRPANP
jgi:thiamine pyrophosphokinase